MCSSPLPGTGLLPVLTALCLKPQPPEHGKGSLFGISRNRGPAVKRRARTLECQNGQNGKTCEKAWLGWSNLTILTILACFDPFLTFSGPRATLSTGFGSKRRIRQPRAAFGPVLVCRPDGVITQGVTRHHLNNLPRGHLGTWLQVTFGCFARRLIALN